MVTISTDYPMSLSIDYPDRKLNKLTTFFRLLSNCRKRASGLVLAPLYCTA